MAKFVVDEDFLPASAGAGSYPPKLAAVAFFDPRLSASKEVVELLDFVDVFSAEHIDIYLRGYTATPPPGVEGASITEITVRGAKRYFSAQKLKENVDTLENETSWRFSWEVDVILFNQHRWYNKLETGVWPDFSDAIVLNVYRMLKDEKITSYASFFCELVRFAKDYEGDNPAWDFSDNKAWKEMKESLFESLKHYLLFRNFRMKVEDYAVQNIKKPNAK